MRVLLTVFAACMFLLASSFPAPAQQRTAIPRDASAKPITLHAGEGIHLKNATNSTAGTLDVVFVFTQV